MDKNQGIHDGLYLSFYNYLWTRIENAKEKYSKVKVLIPNTVIIYESQPIDWYFSDKNGVIKRKKRENLTLEEIQSKFLRDVKSCDIPCYFIHYKKFSKIETKVEEPIIQYLTEKELIDMLDECKREKLVINGILQSFIEPIGTYNTTIQANWSKTLTVFTKRKNVKNLYNKKLSPFERCCTFDGPAFFSEEVPPVGRVTEEIRNLSDSMVQHINDVSYGSINIIRMLLYFKQGNDGKCYFMFGTSMRIESTKKDQKRYEPLAMERAMQIPRNIKLNYTSNLQKPLDLKLSINCLGCGKKKQSSDFTEVSYKQIQLYNQLKEMSKEIKKLSHKKARVESYRFQGDQEKDYVKDVLMKDEKLGIILREREVPAVFKSIYQNINNEVYSKIGKLLDFQQKNVILCWQCFYEITKLIDEEEKLKVKNTEFRVFNSTIKKSVKNLLKEKREKIKEQDESEKKEISTSSKVPKIYFNDTYMRPNSTIFNRRKIKSKRDYSGSQEISVYLSTKTTNLSNSRFFVPKSANLLKKTLKLNESNQT